MIVSYTSYKIIFIIKKRNGNKKKNRRIFKALDSLKPNLYLITIMIDYKKATINATKQEFPSTEVNRCFFNFPSVCGVIFRNLAYKKIKVKTLDLHRR